MPPPRVGPGLVTDLALDSTRGKSNGNGGTIRDLFTGSENGLPCRGIALTKGRLAAVKPSNASAPSRYGGIGVTISIRRAGGRVRCVRKADIADRRRKRNFRRN